MTRHRVQMHGVHLAHEHEHSHRDELVARADPSSSGSSPSPSSSAESSSNFSGQSFALGLLTGFFICAGLCGLAIYVRAQRRRALGRKRATLTPDKFAWSEDGLRGHHIITEPTLGEELASPTSTSFPPDPWAASRGVHDLLTTSNSVPGSPLPAAMRDESGRFTAPPSVVSSEPGSPLLPKPDPAFSQNTLVRATSNASGSSVSRSTITIRTITSTKDKDRDSEKARLEKESALKNKLANGIRTRRNQSGDELRIVNGHPDTRLGTAGAGGGGTDLPPYSREEDPDPFKR